MANLKQRAGLEWTDSFHGIMHLGHLRDEARVSVIDREGSIVLLKYQRNRAPFQPAYEFYSSIRAAKRAGERWLRLFKK